MSQRVVAIVNPAAGQDEPVLSVLSDQLGGVGADWQVRVTTGPADAPAFAREALEEGIDRVLAYGGDGTVSAVAGVLAGSSTPLAILPGGTGNVIAQELGVPLELPAAVALAVQPEAATRAIDVLRMAEQCCLLRVGVGADARMIRGADRAHKDRLGWLAYLLSGWDQIRQPELATYQLELDGTSLEVEALSVLCTNIGRIGRGGLCLADDVLPDDGALDLFVIRDATAASVLSVGASALGLIQPSEVLSETDAAGLYRWRGKHVRVSADPEQEVHGDGERLGTTPLDVRLDPGALRVIVPDGTAGGG